MNNEREFVQLIDNLHKTMNDQLEMIRLLHEKFGSLDKRIYALEQDKKQRTTFNLKPLDPTSGAV